MQEISTRHRKRRICYWDYESKHFDNFKAQVERYVKSMPDFSLAQVQGLDDPNFKPCDLLIIYSPKLNENEFHQWLEGIHKRIQASSKIWTPGCIVSQQLENTDIQRIHEYADTNWYFDIIHPEHWMSFPIRIANLLRIHDHLHELFRYQEQLTHLQTRVADIEQQLEANQRGD